VFYYSSDDRVDFRELIKILATEFKIRVEMKQISLRQEAGRLGELAFVEGNCAVLLGSPTSKMSRLQQLDIKIYR
jgi:cell fate regulator YaaT (PSP1 superfamily)